MWPDACVGYRSPESPPPGLPLWRCSPSHPREVVCRHGASRAPAAQTWPGPSKSELATLSHPAPIQFTSSNTLTSSTLASSSLRKPQVERSAHSSEPNCPDHPTHGHTLCAPVQHLIFFFSTLVSRDPELLKDTGSTWLRTVTIHYT